MHKSRKKLISDAVTDVTALKTIVTALFNRINSKYKYFDGCDECDRFFLITCTSLWCPAGPPCFIYFNFIFIRKLSQLSYILKLLNKKCDNPRKRPSWAVTSVKHPNIIDNISIKDCTVSHYGDHSSIFFAKASSAVPSCATMRIYWSVPFFHSVFLPKSGEGPRCRKPQKEESPGRTRAIYERD